MSDRPSRRWWFIAAIAVLSCHGPIFAEPVRWRSGSADSPHLDRAQIAATLLELSERPDARHVVVQFDRMPARSDRIAWQGAGMRLLSYLGQNSYFAALDRNARNEPALGAPVILGLQPIEPTWKMDPRIVAGDVPEWAIVDNKGGSTHVAIYVLFHPDVDLFGEAWEAATRSGAEVRDALESINGLVVELPAASLSALAAEDAVQWMEWPLPKLSELNDSNRAATEANLVQAPPYNLDGTGVTVLVYDAGTARASHLDFEGRLTVHDSVAMKDHATHVAGTLGGAGVAAPAYKGMAPGVTLLSYGFEYDEPIVILYSNPGDLEDDYDQAINLHGADLANNSLGSNVEINNFDCEIQGNYGVTSALVDTIVAGGLGAPFRVVWAGGNERQGNRCDVEGFGDYYSIAPPAGAKNPIVVGAINSNNDSMTGFSSWGPVDDGRTKPDLVAPGCQTNDDGGVTSCSSAGDTAYSTKCGTSMACPTVTGLAALLLQDFRVQFPSDPDPRNSTLKALFVQNAEDLLNPGPDYQTGFGGVRIQRTIDFMRTGRFQEAEIDQGGRHVVLAEVDAGTDELRITIAWDDVPSTPNVQIALVNDLDLRVFDALSQPYHPWTLDPQDPGATAVRSGPDHLNNIEQVLINDPEPGVYRIEVAGFSVGQGPQPFSLCTSAPIVPCSSQGIVAFAAPAYGCGTAAVVQAIDCDLNTNGSVVEWTTVSVSSTSEPSGETLLLTETGPDTAEFQGTIPLSTVDDVGVLLVDDGDTVTATYIDTDNGLGAVDVSTSTTAIVDCAAPVISDAQVTAIDIDRATVTFNTDEWATGFVRIGLACGAILNSFTEPGLRLSHEVPLTDLTGDTEYFFIIDAFDALGNPSRDSNGGACYSFITRGVVFDFPLDVDPGWTTEGNWAFGPPTGGGSLYGDPTSGYTGSSVYGYNLDGDYTDNLPATYLTTTALDLSHRTGTAVRFRRWLAIEPGQYDHASVEVSNDGVIWTVVWDHTGWFINESSWSLQTYDISAVADGNPEVYIRWGMGPTNQVITLPGWNIDDAQIIADGQAVPTCDDGILNQDEERIDCGGPCPPCDCTWNGDCNDGLYCNGTETCDSFGHCQNGPVVDCDDVVDCTIDLCNETTDARDHLPDNAVCDNGLFCDGAETCDLVLDCQTGGPVNCGDGVECTVDFCNEGTDACDHLPDNGRCDNGLFCDGLETCDPVLDCQAGTPVDCADGVDCTVDSCNETGDACIHVPNDADCDNGLFCDGAETCDPVAGCQPGVMVDCDDGVSCTVDSCNEQTDQCDNVADAMLCDDGLFCDGFEVCVPGLGCQLGVPVNCDDGVNCTLDSCNEETDTCDNIPDDAYCDDGAYCDGPETCDPVGGCQYGASISCDDGVFCTVDACNEQTDSCDNIPDALLCDNGLYCDGEEICDSALGCLAGAPVDCDDQVTCTDDACNESSDTCLHVPNDGLCSDSRYCTGVETCHPDLGCLAGVPVNCDDGLNCTEDACNEIIDACDNIPIDIYCDNGLFCDGAEFCDPGFGCRAGEYPCVPDELCRESDDQCVECLVHADCDDGDPCNGTERCRLDGTCYTRVTADCNENGVEDSCDIDDGTSPDCQPNGIPDECDLLDCPGSADCADCDENGIPDACDIAAGASDDVNGNGVPDQCDMQPPAPPAGTPCDDPDDCGGADAGADCVGGSCYAPKNRYLSFDPTVNSVAVAYQVELIESAAYPAAAGRTWWVGTPHCHNYPDGKIVTPTPTTCTEPTRFAWVSPVTSTPVTRIWNEYPVHITGCPIVPEVSYQLRASHDAGVTFSEPLFINTIHRPQSGTQSWGDITGGPVPGALGLWLPPNGATDFSDVANAIRTFENRTTGSGHPPRLWVDMEVNQVINLVDIQFVVSAFQGSAYTDVELELIGTDPADCP